MKKGFTLIELLVVVLIIGNLAAVALPQYQKAVEKSRTREAILTLGNMQKAWDLCVMQYGNAAEECGGGENGLFSRMDIEIPGILVEDNSCDNALGCYVTKDWAYDFDGGGMTAHRVTNSENIGSSPYWLYDGRGPGSPNEPVTCGEIVSGACKNVCGANDCIVQ